MTNQKALNGNIPLMPYRLNSGFGWISMVTVNPIIAVLTNFVLN